MPAFQRFTAVLLAATYLVVGAMGDGLHYLVESPRAEVVAEDSGHGAYSHDHGDGLWHVHGSHGHDGVAASRPARQDEQDEAEGAADADASLAHLDASHEHNHSTLLLAIASAMEQSLLECLLLSQASQPEPSIDSADHCLAHACDGAGLGPRGPPANGLA